jgi:hypothetical protein
MLIQSAFRISDSAHKKISSDKIGFYGKPIDRLTREELIQALIELGSAIKECAAENTKCQKFIFIKKNKQKVM